MRTTVTLDDELVKQAREYTGIAETSLLLRTALTSLVQREAARRLAALGGSMPGAKAPGRRHVRPDGTWASTEDAEHERRLVESDEA